MSNPAAETFDGAKRQEIETVKPERSLVEHLLAFLGLERFDIRQLLQRLLGHEKKNRNSNFNTETQKLIIEAVNKEHNQNLKSWEELVYFIKEERISWGSIMRSVNDSRYMKSLGLSMKPSKMTEEDQKEHNRKARQRMIEIWAEEAMKEGEWISSKNLGGISNTAYDEAKAAEMAKKPASDVIHISTLRR